MSEIIKETTLALSSELMRQDVIFKKQVKAISFSRRIHDVTKIGLIKGLSALSRERFLYIWNPSRYMVEYD